MRSIKPCLIWDTYEIARGQAEYLVDEEGLSEDEAWAQATTDFEWEYLVESLTEIMSKLNPQSLPWTVGVVNMGWRNWCGDKFITAENGQELLDAILPNTDCAFKIFIDEMSKTISINNFHHDSPSGNEWYHIKVEEE